MKKLKKLSREDLKTVKGGQVWYAETSCGVQATTTQDWTAEQANAWMEALEANYCKPAIHSGPSNNLA
ncbi:bacteriocin-like protein [Chryseobacterium sp. 22532]|uniref:bacteriocin-like protein n=1 Tax=Chryseobacterium sp. 22532 TaxID=3453938 RepID=UPI003F840FFD